MLFVDVLGLIGTAAFAVSGALIGIKRKLDLFGVFMLAIFTASGGGLIRDVLLKENLPVLFAEPRYFIVIAVSAIVTCITINFLIKIYNIIIIFDAIGLGVFTILAAYKSMTLQVPFIGVVFIAVFTGIGGGIIRDILINEVPLVFRSEIYAMASIIGCLAFYFSYGHIETNLNIYINILVVFVLRMISVYFKINLPTIRLGSE